MQVEYIKSKKIVKIDARSSEVNVDYLEYVFKYLKIPANVRLQFKEKTIGGIEEWKKQQNSLKQK